MRPIVNSIVEVGKLKYLECIVLYLDNIEKEHKHRSIEK